MLDDGSDPSDELFGCSDVQNDQMVEQSKKKHQKGAQLLDISQVYAPLECVHNCCFYYFSRLRFIAFAVNKQLIVDIGYD
jgi:hypothetical protein